MEIKFLLPDWIISETGRGKLEIVDRESIEDQNLVAGTEKMRRLVLILTHAKRIVWLVFDYTKASEV